MLRHGKRVYAESYFEGQPGEEWRLLWRSAALVHQEPNVDGSSRSGIPSSSEGAVFSCAGSPNLMAILAPTIDLLAIHGGASFGLFNSRFSTCQVPLVDTMNRAPRLTQRQNPAA